MSSLRDLRLPVTPGGEGKENNLGGWDETFGDSEWKYSTSRHWEKPSIASHAVAHGSLVCGTQPNDGTGEWITWQTSFAPHRVCRVASNDDGSIIVASTDGGTVSLLRGHDGKVLATRRVSSSESLQRPAEIMFVGGAGRHSSNDVLIIFVPVADDNIDGSPEDEVHIILVSSIDGGRLNDTNTTTVATAARSMSIDALHLESPSRDFEAVQGCFLSKGTIRFAAGDSDGSISIHDYDVETKKTMMVKESIEIEGTECKMKFLNKVGIGLQVFGLDHAYLVLCSPSETSFYVFWYDLVHLSTACDYALQSTPSTTLKRPIMLSLIPVKSCSDESALAVAVALKPSADAQGGSIQVIQSVVEETLGLAVLSKPHVVYDVPLGSSHSTMSLQAADVAPLGGQLEGPYSFRFQMWFGSENYEYKEFVTRHERLGGTTMGRLRLLIQQEKYDEADDIIAVLGSDGNLSDSFAMFHSSEVALCRLKNMLQGGDVTTEDNLGHARECFRRLVAAVVSGSEMGLRYMLEAADSIAAWPDTCRTYPTIGQFSMALSTMVSSINSAVNSSPFHASQLEPKKNELMQRLKALRCMETLIQSTSTTIKLSPPFSGVRSPSDLFTTLMKEGYYSLAQQLWRSEGGRELAAEILASSVLRITPAVDPRAYANVLKDTVIPALSINHEALPLIRSWACRTADAFDEDESNLFGLDASIFLLETVLSATKKLNLRVHSSFASFTPFVDRRETRKPRQSSPRNELSDTSSLNFSFKSESLTSSRHRSSSEFSERPIPTIMELGRLKGGAMKSRLRSLSKHGSKDITATVDDEGDENEESVEIKLRHARQLLDARRLGLTRSSSTLKYYAALGGPEHVAKEVVRLYSESATNHDERIVALSSTVKQFCANACVNFDDVLIQYTTELCESKETNESAIIESASIARCCSTTAIKCQVALTVLRAALLCGSSPSCLDRLSVDALDWADFNPSVRSELKEATRLLVIDGIVRRYCGAGARELFRVENPSHAIRLLDFVCRHISTTSVVEDGLDLCDAFTHLSRDEACALIMQRAVASSESDLCVQILTKVMLIDANLAQRACGRTVDYCCEILEFSSDSHSTKDRSIAVVAVVIALLETLQTHSYALSEDEMYSIHHMRPSWVELMSEFKRISSLQRHHGLFLSLSDLRTMRKAFNAAKSSLQPVVDAYSRGCYDNVAPLFAHARGACGLLVGHDETALAETWCAAVGEAAAKLAWTTGDGRCVDFIAASGVLNDTDMEAAIYAILSLSVSLCRRASSDTLNRNGIIPRMEDVIRASSLVQDHAMIGCPDRVLVAAVSLGLLTETVTQVLVRSDEGAGEELDGLRTRLGKQESSLGHSKMQRNGQVHPSSVHTLHLRKATLHPSWYVGDGLLLPPSDALSRSVDYCKSILDILMMTNGDDVHKSKISMRGSFGLHRFLGERGAHAMALRVTCIATTIALSSSQFPSKCQDETIADNCLYSHQETVGCLAERSLGSSGNGITNVTIDSQVAAPLLLSLPIKHAFKTYKASFPSAIAKRDFSRVITLSNIGILAGGGQPFRLGDHFSHIGWKNQPNFVSQCENLSSKGRWWKVLQAYKVDFDPSRLDDRTSTGSFESDHPKTDEIMRGRSAYIASLLPPLIRNASRSLRSPELVQNLGNRFVCSFGLEQDLALQKHIEFLLSYPHLKSVAGTSDWTNERISSSHELVHRDIRSSLQVCEQFVRRAISCIPSAMKRSAILRRCVVALEANEESHLDYERHTVVLSLYHMDLAKVIAEDSTMRTLAPFEEELELIERRRDALAILSSFFQGDQKPHRPPFPKFFFPLPVPFQTQCEKKVELRHYSVLGFASGVADTLFDPLAPLQPFLEHECDAAATTALAPLSIPLGLPQGYIHARSLIIRFQKSARHQGQLPSFEVDVLPVLNRLSLSRDQAELAEWCSDQYDDSDEQKLKCIDHALSCAIQASSELEHRLRCHSTDVDQEMATDERRALDDVKRISSIKSSLCDKLQVNRILQSNMVGSYDQFRTVQRMIDGITKRLQDFFWTAAESSPEAFVESLLTEASLLAANACLDESRSFSVSHFRQMASTIHRACKEIGDQYSHVHAGYISRSLARRWLVHGDELLSTVSGNGSLTANKEAPLLHKSDWNLSTLEEDDTVNFVMDLNSLGGTDAVWSDDIGTVVDERKSENVTIEEEPSALTTNGSYREASEFACARVSLRIAFVMSFAEGYHVSKEESLNDENESIHANTQRSSKGGTSRNRLGLLSRITSTGSRQLFDVLEHARELLRIVFARSGGSDSMDTSISFMSNVSEADGRLNDRKTLTFAMRYRALRTASILCPQDALERVAKEERYLMTSNSEAECSLMNCAFGSFLAKEIEEMGLPLPHSDLVQLSTMHFPSYARALWRHHKDGVSGGAKGRLLLLLLEMSLKEDVVVDPALTSALLNEMAKTHLPRTLLLACECILRFKARVGSAQANSIFSEGGNALSNALLTAARTILSESFNCVTAGGKSPDCLRDGLPTLRRLGEIVEQFVDTDDGMDQLAQFVEVLLGLMDNCGSDGLSDAIADIALSGACCLNIGDKRNTLFKKLESHQSGRSSIQRRRSLVQPNEPLDSTETLASMMHSLECSLKV